MTALSVSLFPLPLPSSLFPLPALYFLAETFYLRFMTARWFGATYYFVFIGYSRWGPRSRVR